jgi:hypothetical protein
VKGAAKDNFLKANQNLFLKYFLLLEHSLKGSFVIISVLFLLVLIPPLKILTMNNMDS